MLGCCVSHETMPVWRGLTDRRPDSPNEVFLTRDQNRNNCLALLAVAGGVGANAYWVRRSRTRPLEAGDYADGPSGSGLDGRG